MRREIGLDCLMRKYILSPLEQNKISSDCLPQPILKFPDFSLTFQVLSKLPWPSKKFHDFSLTWKKFHFPDIFPCGSKIDFTLTVAPNVGWRCAWTISSESTSCPIEQNKISFLKIAIANNFQIP